MDIIIAWAWVMPGTLESLSRKVVIAMLVMSFNAASFSCGVPSVPNASSMYLRKSPGWIVAGSPGREASIAARAWMETCLVAWAMALRWRSSGCS